MRPFWSGTITFGLVNVPVSLFPANRSSRTSLRMLAEDGTPLSRRYWCPEEERDVPPEEIVRGYRLESGDYVVVDDEELEELEPRKSREIDMRRFVDQDEIPPLFFERGYYLTPSGDSSKAYRLLAEAMERTGRAGVATFVMRGKEYLIAVLADHGVLRAETLRFHDEVRGVDDVGLPEKASVKRTRVDSLRKEIRAHVSDFDPDELEDEQAERLLALAEEKREEGRVVHREKEDEAAPAGSRTMARDLLESIRRSLAEGDGSGGDGTGGDGADGSGKARGDGASGGGRGTGFAPSDRRSRRTRDTDGEEGAMPKGWSQKDERKYEHIKESTKERGASKERAKEVAARTVNKDRRQQGRTPNKKTQGSGKPGESLGERTKDELYNMAANMDIEGRSKMKKDELISAIREQR